MTDWKQAAEEYIGNLPSPQAPSIKNKDYPTAVQLASYSKFGGIASPKEAEGFYQAFNNMNQQMEAQGKHPYSPEDYKRAIDQLAPLSYAYHDRPPTMSEIATYGDEHPTKQRDYYSNLPDQHYPTMTAGQAVAATVAASPHSMENLGRGPVKSEVHYLVHSGENPATYYQRVGAQQPNAVPGTTGGKQGAGGPQALGRRAVDH